MSTRAALTLQETFARAIERIDQNLGLAAVGPDLLAILARPFNCKWATHWKVDPKRGQLYPASIWQESAPTARLYGDTIKRQLSMSEGTAGHVWRSQKPIWTTNIVLDMCLPRSLDAQEADLHGGVWFALKTNTAVYGVIEMLGQKLDPANEEVLTMIELVGISMGLLIETAHMRNLGQ